MPRRVSTQATGSVNGGSAGRGAEIGAIDPAGELRCLARGISELVQQVGIGVHGGVEDQQHLGDGAADEGCEVDLHIVPLVRVEDLALPSPCAVARVPYWSRGAWSDSRLPSSRTRSTATQVAPQVCSASSTGCTNQRRASPGAISRPGSASTPGWAGSAASHRSPAGPVKRTADGARKPAASLLVGEPTGPGSAVTIMESRLSTGRAPGGEAGPAWGALPIAPRPPGGEYCLCTSHQRVHRLREKSMVYAQAPQGRSMPPRPPRPRRPMWHWLLLGGVAASDCWWWASSRVFIGFQLLTRGNPQTTLDDFYSSLWRTPTASVHGVHDRGVPAGDRADELRDVRGGLSGGAQRVDYQIDERINRQGYRDLRGHRDHSPGTANRSRSSSASTCAASTASGISTASKWSRRARSRSPERAARAPAPPTPRDRRIDRLPPRPIPPMAAASGLVGLDAAHLGGGGLQRRRTIGDQPHMEGGIGPADRAHRGELHDLLGHRHQRGQRLEGAAVVGDAESGDLDLDAGVQLSRRSRGRGTGPKNCASSMATMSGPPPRPGVSSCSARSSILAGVLRPVCVLRRSVPPRESRRWPITSTDETCQPGPMDPAQQLLGLPGEHRTRDHVQSSCLHGAHGRESYAGR